MAGYLVVVGVEDNVDDKFVDPYVFVDFLGGWYVFPLEGNVYNKHGWDWHRAFTAKRLIEACLSSSSDWVYSSFSGYQLDMYTQLSDYRGIPAYQEIEEISELNAKALLSTDERRNEKTCDHLVNAFAFSSLFQS